MSPRREKPGSLRKPEVDLLKRLSRIHGVAGRRAYDRARSSRQRSSGWLVRIYGGTWAAVCEQAGVTALHRTVWSEADCNRALRAAKKALGRSFARADYEKFRQETGVEDLWPSGKRLAEPNGWHARASALGITPRGRRAYWTREKLLPQLRECLDKEGRVSARAWDDFAAGLRAEGRRVAAKATVVKVMGSWENAKRACGP